MDLNREHPSIETYLGITFRLLLTGIVLFLGANRMIAQGTAFTYQGKLNIGSSPANGSYDFTFALYSVGDPLPDTQIADALTNIAIPVVNGLFTATLDFGPSVFLYTPGYDVWIEIGVRTNGSGTFSILSPRQEITPMPYTISASFAQNAQMLQGYAYGSAVASGTGNNITYSSFNSIVGGGSSNMIGAGDAGNPVYNTTNNVITGGCSNRIEFGALCDIAGGSGNIIFSGSSSSISGGRNNSVRGDFSIITGGATNSIVSPVGGPVSGSIIGGGLNNTITAPYSIVGGGTGNTNEAARSAVAGGSNNTIKTNAIYSGIVSGGYNTIQTNANGSFVGGGWSNTIGVSASQSSVIGGQYNAVNASYAVIGGGLYNSTLGLGEDYGVICGGQGNQLGGFPGAPCAAICSGLSNANSSAYSFIGGGVANSVFGGFLPGGSYSVVDGGRSNSVRGSYSAVAGGQNNFVIGDGNTVGGGAFNIISASGNAVYNGTIPGGYSNSVTASDSLAAGFRAKANNVGAFVWADSQNSDFASTANDQVSFRCQGGVRFTSGSGTANQTVSWAPGTASWSFTSDRNAKERFAPVMPQSVLEKVSKLPLSEWNYKGHSQRHIGPVAQDFHELFPLNPNDKMIDEGDLHGVALAAIQGLNEKLRNEAKEKDVKIDRLEKENDALEKRIRTLEELVRPLVQQK